MLTPHLSDIEHWQVASPKMHPEVRPVLLLMAYECMPDRGSDARAGWERVLRAAREFEVHAIVGAESFAAIERYRETNAVPRNICFHTPKEDVVYGLLKSMPRLFVYDCIGYRPLVVCKLQFRDLVGGRRLDLARIDPIGDVIGQAEQR